MNMRKGTSRPTGRTHSPPSTGSDFYGQNISNWDAFPSNSGLFRAAPAHQYCAISGAGWPTQVGDTSTLKPENFTAQHLIYKESPANTPPFATATEIEESFFLINRTARYRRLGKHGEVVEVNLGPKGYGS